MENWHVVVNGQESRADGSGKLQGGRQGQEPCPVGLVLTKE